MKNLNFIHKILIPVYIYASIVIFVVLTKPCQYFDATSPCLSYVIASFLVIPIILIFETVRRRRKFWEQAPHNVRFLLYMAPGAVPGIAIAYGIWSMGHGFFILDFVFVSVVALVISVFSGLLGILMDDLFDRLKKRNSPPGKVS